MSIPFGFIDWVGYVGGAVLLFAFWRTSIGKWTGKSLWYELDNLIAGIMLTVYAFEKGAYASVVINIVWATVAFRGVTSYAERQLRTHKK